jgi:hypothetical protein
MPDPVMNFAIAFPQSSLAVFAGARGQRSFSERSVCVYDWSKQCPISDIECTEAVSNILGIGAVFAFVFQSEVRLYNLQSPIPCRPIPLRDEFLPPHAMLPSGAVKRSSL